MCGWVGGCRWGWEWGARAGASHEGRAAAVAQGSASPPPPPAIPCSSSSSWRGLEWGGEGSPWVAGNAGRQPSPRKLLALKKIKLIE